MMKIGTLQKVFILLFCFAIATTGFLIKLPSAFRHYDKELHALFYFLAAAFLNLLFNNRNIIRHALIFIFLYLFSIAIEFTQEYSNTFLHKRIHGRYDVEDVEANVRGLILFSIIWLVYVAWWQNRSVLRKRPP